MSLTWCFSCIFVFVVLFSVSFFFFFHLCFFCFFFFQAEDGIRDHCVTGVQTCALPISHWHSLSSRLFFPCAQGPFPRLFSKRRQDAQACARWFSRLNGLVFSSVTQRLEGRRLS